MGKRFQGSTKVPTRPVRGVTVPAVRRVTGDGGRERATTAPSPRRQKAAVVGRGVRRPGCRAGISAARRTAGCREGWAMPNACERGKAGRGRRSRAKLTGFQKQAQAVAAEHSLFFDFSHVWIVHSLATGRVLGWYAFE